MINLSTQDAKPVRQQEVLTQPLGDEMVLYPLEGKAIHVLNRTAFAVWELCDGTHDLAQIEDKIRKQFVVHNPQANIANDIKETLQQLEDKGLVTVTQ